MPRVVALRTHIRPISQLGWGWGGHAAGGREGQDADWLWPHKRNVQFEAKMRHRATVLHQSAVILCRSRIYRRQTEAAEIKLPDCRKHGS